MYPADGMNSYLEWNSGQKTTTKMLNPAATSYEPLSKNALPQSSFPLLCKDSSAPPAQPDEKGQQRIIGLKQKTKLEHRIERHGTTQHQTHSLPANNVQPALEDEQQHTHPLQMQGDICTIMHRQNEITAALVQQQRGTGDTQDTQCGSDGLKGVNKSKSQPKFSRVRGNSFATTVTIVDSTKESKGSRSVPEKHDSVKRSNHLCVCCSQVHSLEECPKLEKKRHQDKIVFLKEKGICFGCLCIGHRSKDCNRRLTCKVCSQNHPSVLHITKKPVFSMDSEQSKETTLVTPSSSETCGHSGETR